MAFLVSSVGRSSYGFSVLVSSVMSLSSEAADSPKRLLAFK